MLDPKPSGLFTNFLSPTSDPSPLASLFSEAFRSRASWNQRFEHWEAPASITEAGTIERAERNVRAALAKNGWLNASNISVVPQGSYHNQTNVRSEADIDLRVVHPLLRVDYDPQVPAGIGYQLGYTYTGQQFDMLFAEMRRELTSALWTAFGFQSINPKGLGKKAIRIAGITGSRAEVDVVPAVRYHYVSFNLTTWRYEPREGVAILSTDGHWTINYPEQHAANGIAKREATARRFKKYVRIFKRLRSEMKEQGILKVEVPSFLVECLVYCVEDEHFLVDADDRYNRVLRIAARLQGLLGNPLNAAVLREINGIKLLFGPEQPWTRETALTFVNCVIQHVGG